MRHALFTEDENSDSLKAAILIRNSAFDKKKIWDNYVFPLGLDKAEEVIAFDLHYSKDNPPAKEIKAYLQELLEGCESLGITTIYCADAKYFKPLSGLKKTTNAHGEIYPVAIKGFEHMDCILGVSYRASMYDPKQGDKLISSVQVLKDHMEGTFKPKELIIGDESTYNFYGTDAKALMDLHKHPVLAVDIEAWGEHEGDVFRFNKNTLASIAFSWSATNGHACTIDTNYDLARLAKFFEDYEGKTIFHNGLFDIKHLIYHCFMSSPEDIKGMLHGINVMCKNVDDTMIMKYLTTNSTAGNTLGLKDAVQSYTGNYAEDVKDVRKLPIHDLLVYNLKDTLGTYWLWEQQNTLLDTEGQREIYEKVFMPSFPVLLEMMLVGLPMNMSTISNVESKLTHTKLMAQMKILNHPLIDKVRFKTATAAMVSANNKLKKKVKPLSDFMTEFNPGSNSQKAVLFYEVMKLPVIDTTKSGGPSASGKTIKKLIKHCTAEEDKELLQAFIDYSDAEKILNTFIKAFKHFELKRGDTSWLNGSQKLGGTLSGRLSSADPNLANLPSNSVYGKDIKSCFEAPDGWLFAGSDYAALEDRVVAIISKDPNKRRIFTEGIDGHSLNAYGYFKDQMPDINPDDPNSINSIAEVYEALRQKSKAPTFALNYGGTYLTLHKNSGIPIDEAMSIEEGHKEMYKVLHAWGEENKLLMTQQGYITGAYGLKIRTPMLAKSLINAKVTPSIVKAEFRSGNNAVTQSHGLMTTVAGTKFKEMLDDSIFRDNVLIINFIHDAVYLLIKEDLATIQWVNEKLIECMVNAGDEQVEAGKHIVPIEANLDIGKTWADQHQLPNRMTNNELREILKDIHDKT